jgi:hypothetical protein
MRYGKEALMPLQSASAADAREWADELFTRARRAAFRARIHAVTDRFAARLVACAVLVGAMAGLMWWVNDRLSQL